METAEFNSAVYRGSGASSVVIPEPSNAEPWVHAVETRASGKRQAMMAADKSNVAQQSDLARE